MSHLIASVCSQSLTPSNLTCVTRIEQEYPSGRCDEHLSVSDVGAATPQRRKNDRSRLPSLPLPTSSEECSSSFPTHVSSSLAHSVLDDPELDDS